MATVTTYTKDGIDAKAAPLATDNPLVAGTATPGTSGSAARSDHVHPRQVDLLSQNITADRYAYPIGPRDGTSPTDYTNERALAYPFAWFPTSGGQGFGELAVQVQAAGNAGAVAKCRIFPLDGSVATFDNYVVEYPDIDASATGVKYALPLAPSGPQRGFFVFVCLVVGADATVPQFMRATAWGSPEAGPLQVGGASTRQSVRVDNATAGWPASGVLDFKDNAMAPWFNLKAV